MEGLKTILANAIKESITTERDNNGDVKLYVDFRIVKSVINKRMITLQEFIDNLPEK